MFDSLSGRLDQVLSKLKSRGRLSEADVDAALREIRLALLEADVNVGVARTFVERVRSRALGEELSKSLAPGLQVIKIVNDELTEILGGSSLKITYASHPPTVVLLAGLQGSGKTTAAAKLARWFKQQGRNPAVVGADLQRPAAVEQLRVLAAQVGVPMLSDPAGPVEAARVGVEQVRRMGRDVVIIDTAGRLVIDAELMDQVRAISEAVTPHYTFLVIDAMIGQEAVVTAEAFHAALELDAVILTKLDGDARGGAALSVKEVVGRPIAFASTGEKLADFETFYPDRMAGRILGKGDMLSLIEKTEQVFDEHAAEKAASALQEGRFTLDDFLAQMQQIKKMGPLQNLVGMLPGLPAELKGAQVEESQLARVEAMIHSMTPAERRDPSLINGSRRTRIAKGSGCTTSEVNMLLDRFKLVQRAVKGFGGGGRGKKAKRGRVTPSPAAMKGFARDLGLG
ncbi:MAG: signal recognition particle protein [Acidimicrobiales bacterium]